MLRRCAHRAFQQGCQPHIRRLSTQKTPERQSTVQSLPKTAIFFPGQGVQRVSMLSNLQTSFPRTINKLIEELDHTIAESDKDFPPPPSASPGRSLSDIIANGPADLLTATENAQPAILFTSFCILSVLQNDFGLDLRKLSPCFLGHSLGEFTSLVAANILTLPQAVTLVRRRGISMTMSVPESESHDVGMFAIISPTIKHLTPLLNALSPENLAKLPENIIPPGKIVQVANHNTSTQFVLSGHVSAIKSVLHHLREFSGHDPRAIRLKVSAPFHCQLMEPAVEVIDRQLSKVEIDWNGRFGEVISNVTARPYESLGEMRKNIPLQATERVRWAESVKWLDEVAGVEKWVGFGPGEKVGRGLVAKEVRGGVIMVGEQLGPQALEEIAKSLMKEGGGRA